METKLSKLNVDIKEGDMIGDSPGELNRVASAEAFKEKENTVTPYHYTIEYKYRGQVKASIQPQQKRERGILTRTRYLAWMVQMVAHYTQRMFKDQSS